MAGTHSCVSGSLIRDCTCSKWSVCLFIHTVMLSVPAASKVC